MADIRYFNDTTGEAIELKAPYGMDNKEFAAKFPEMLTPVWRAFRYDGYSMWVGYPKHGSGGPLPVTRKIEYKSQPSKHECNAKCMGGKANGTCECRCGGKNHGAGMFTSLMSASA